MMPSRRTYLQGARESAGVGLGWAGAWGGRAGAWAGGRVGVPGVPGSGAGLGLLAVHTFCSWALKQGHMQPAAGCGPASKGGGDGRRAGGTHTPA